MYELSDVAAKDIEQILNRSIVDFGLPQTELYYHSLKNCLGLLGENPNMGSIADDIRPGYRRFAHESHVIFYRDTGRGILIVRILHKRMDINKHIDK
jgi:toxin ParE1/3/4